MDISYRTASVLQNCVNHGEKCGRDTDISQVLGKEIMNHTWAFECYAHFKAGQTSADDKRISSTMPAVVVKIEHLICEDQHHSIADEVRTGYETCQQILT